MVGVRDPIMIHQLEELAADDRALVEVEEELRRVSARREVIGRKYAVMRDIVTRQLGFSPYTKPVELPNGVAFEFDSGGAFRFIHMDTGSAALAALKESDHPMTLDEIVQVLSQGGIGFQPE